MYDNTVGCQAVPISCQHEHPVPLSTNCWPEASCLCLKQGPWSRPPHQWGQEFPCHGYTVILALTLSAPAQRNPEPEPWPPSPSGPPRESCSIGFSKFDTETYTTGTVLLRPTTLYFSGTFEEHLPRLLPPLL